MMWKYQYDDEYSMMEREFAKYENLDYEAEEIVSRHYKYGR